MEKQFSEQESLELINQMINSAKNNLQKGMGNVFLLWGYLVAFSSLINLILLISLPHRINHYAYFIWYLMPLGLILHYFLIGKIMKSSTVKTYVDKIMGYVWIAFAISVLVLVIAMSLASVINSSGEFITLSGTRKTIQTGPGLRLPFWYSINLKQNVETTDKSLGTNRGYRIVITFEAWNP